MSYVEGWWTGNKHRQQQGQGSEVVSGKVGSPVPLVSVQQWAVKAQSTGTVGSIHGLVNTGQQHKPQSAGCAFVEASGQSQVKSNYQLISGTGSLTAPGSHCLSRLAGQRPPGYLSGAIGMNGYLWRS